MLQYVCDAVSRSKLIDEVTIATSDEESDVPIGEFAEKQNWNCFRGSLHNVTERFLLASKKHNADVIVRICGDSPLIDSRVIDLAVDAFLKGTHRIVCNVRPRTFPFGCSVEVFAAETLRQSIQESIQDGDFEHVTPAIYRTFSSEIFNLTHQPDLSRFRLTVDTLEDFHRIEHLMHQLGDDPTRFSVQQISSRLDGNNEVAA